MKLEANKQREAKSEQGRYANACRRLYGRTRSRGINGVRERLREILGESPDLDEMERELTATRGMEDIKGRGVRMQWNKIINPSKNCHRTTQGTRSQQKQFPRAVIVATCSAIRRTCCRLQTKRVLHNLCCSM